MVICFSGMPDLKGQGGFEIFLEGRGMPERFLPPPNPPTDFGMIDEKTKK